MKMTHTAVSPLSRHAISFQGDDAITRPNRPLVYLYLGSVSRRDKIGRSPVRFALNDFTLSFTLFPKALFTFRSHYFFAVGLGAPCLAFADGHLPVCTARSNCATLRRGVD
jgi:hypothetical protein